MSLFENFPYTNLHELNLDWLIGALKQLEETQVLSVNGQTGHVILYQDADIVLPTVEQDHWSIVRMSDETTRGIMFGNDDKAYIVHGNLMDALYGVNNPPPYPVTSVNGETGDITLYAAAQVVLPTLTEAELHNWNIYRQINGVIRGIQFNDTGKLEIIEGANRYPVYSSNNLPFGEAEVQLPGVTDPDQHDWNIWKNVNNTAYGIQFNDNGTAELIVGSNRYTIYTSNTQPSYPVTSVNNQTGNVVLTIPDAFVDNPAAAELKIAEDVTDSATWALIRETENGYAGICVDTDSSTEGVYLQKGDGVSATKIKLLTQADIPSGSGVISINGLTGVVVISGADLNVSTTDTRKINVVLSGLETDVSALQDMDDYIREALVFDELGQTTAIHNIPAGSFVYWNNGTYTASQAISIGDTLSSTNLTAVPAGGAINALNSNIVWKSAGYASGQNEVDLSGISFQELCIIVHDGRVNTATVKASLCAVNVPRIALDSIPSQFILESGTATGNNDPQVMIRVSTGMARMESVVYSGVSHVNDATMTVYYR